MLAATQAAAPQLRLALRRAAGPGRRAAHRDADRRPRAARSPSSPARRSSTARSRSLCRRCSQQYRKQRSQAETLLSVAAIGLFACALACLGLLAALSYDRRRNETELSRTRGASPHHLLAAQAAESFLISAPAALLGWGLAALLVDGRGSSLSAWLAVAIVAATVLLPVLAIAGTARRPLGARAREDVVTGRPSARRLAVEGLVVVGAGVGVYLLRRRGLDTGSGTGGFDPYLAGVPVLLGLACGILALRLYPRAARRPGAGRAARTGPAAAPGVEQGGAAARGDLAAADRARPRARDRDVRGRDGEHARRRAGSLELARDRRRPARGRRARRDAADGAREEARRDRRRRAGVRAGRGRRAGRAGDRAARARPGRLRAHRRRHAGRREAAEVDPRVAADPEPGSGARLQRLPGRRQLPEHPAR